MAIKVYAEIIYKGPRRLKHTLQLAPYKKARRLAYYLGLEEEDVVNGDIFFCTMGKLILFIEVMITNDKPAAEHACTWEI